MKELNKEIIYEEFFKQVDDSTDFSSDGDDFKYTSYIDGVCDMTKRLLRLLDKLNA